MGGRIHDHVLNRTIAPAQRRDRSLDLWFGVPPESVRDDDIMFGTWGSDLWPGWSWAAAPPTLMIGDPVFDWGPDAGSTAWASDIRFTGGKQTGYVIAGLCVDSLSSPVAGASVELWRSVDEVFMQSQLSQSNGYYCFWVPDTVTPFYVVAWKGAPQIAGITVRNLVGSAA